MLALVESNCRQYPITLGGDVYYKKNKGKKMGIQTGMIVILEESRKSSLTK